MGDDKLDARFIPGGLWTGASVLATSARAGSVTGIVLQRKHDGWRFEDLIAGITRKSRDDGSGWSLSLLLPGEGGGNAHRLERRVQERLAGVAVVPEWCRTLPAAEASKRLVMTDALADSLDGEGADWPTGPGAPVWAWTEADLPDLHGGRQWKLSARASSTESWSAWFGCELTDPMEALEATWRKECA